MQPEIHPAHPADAASPAEELLAPAVREVPRLATGGANDGAGININHFGSTEYSMQQFGSALHVHFTSSDCSLIKSSSNRQFKLI